MHHLPRFFNHGESSKGMEKSKQNRKLRKLERQNASNNIDYEPTASSPSEESSSLRKIARCSPFHDPTSFRLEGNDGEIDIICQKLGLSPDDFAIPAAAWEARKGRGRSSSDLLPRSHMSPKVSEQVNVASLSDGFADIVKVREFNDGELAGRLGFSARRTTDRSGPAEPIQSPLGGRVGRGINGVRPPLLAPPPAISLPAFDSTCSTWDILRSFAPEGDTGSSIVTDEGVTSDDDDDEEVIITRDGEAFEVRFGETVVLSESCSFTTTSSNYDDSSSSSTTTDHTPNISPNLRLRRTITSWRKGELLGRGSFGSVYEGIADDGFFFALKEVSLLEQGDQGKQSIYQLEQEIALLSLFEHENIVQYYGTAKDDSKLYIFLEQVNKGSLLSLYQKYHLRDPQVSAYTRQILHGLKYLHDQNVIHRDIKCANILVDVNGSVKLADFGVAKFTKLNDVKSCKGTPCWMAPEVVRGRGYGISADIWSLGCTVLEMLTRQIPYSDLECQMQAIYKIGQGEAPSVPESLSVEAREFIHKCLQTNPSDRPSAAQLLDDPFVKRPASASSPHSYYYCK